MKKIMFAILVAACAVAVNGAQIQWKLQATTKADATAAGLGSNTTVYMILSSALASSYSAESDIAAAAVMSETFTIASKSAYALGTYASSSVTIGDTVSYSLVLVDTDNSRYSVFGAYTSSAATADGANDYADGVLQPAVSPILDTQKVELSTASWTSFGGGGGSGGIPEPTSGLLLLIGGSLLALRRKQK